MLGDVWRWAGEYRTSERNIGINHWEIPMALRVLLDDVKLWIEKNVYPVDEIAVRFTIGLSRFTRSPMATAGMPALWPTFW